MAQLLPTLHHWKLKYAAFLVGSQYGGTKGKLTSDILACLSQDLVAGKRKTRILSIDMGLRNLGYCIVEVPIGFASRPPHLTTLDVLAWKRKDLLNDQTVKPAMATDANSPQNEGVDPKLNIGDELDKTIFTRPNMAKLAYKVSRDLLEYRPQHILIEKQRHRTGGHAAVQEWTIRVNTFEAMLWACFETLRQAAPSPSAIEALHAVDPRQAAKFWIAGSKYLLSPFDALLDPAKSEGQFDIQTNKVEKRDRIDILASWINEDDSGEGIGKGLAARNRMKLNFATEEAAASAQLFESQAAKHSKVAKGGKALERRARQPSWNKLDDLTDSLMQAAAWVRWQQNRVALRQMLGLEHLHPAEKTIRLGVGVA